jgi:hypothetical protein
MLNLSRQLASGCLTPRAIPGLVGLWDTPQNLWTACGLDGDYRNPQR